MRGEEKMNSKPHGIFRRNVSLIGRVVNLLIGIGIAAGIGWWVLSGDADEPLPAPLAAEGQTAAAEEADDGISSAPAGDNTPPDVAVLSSRAQELVYDFVLRGFTEAARAIEVRAQTGGLVNSVSVPKGSRVREGSPLCQIEPGDRPARLAEAQASIAKAEADADSARQLAREGFGTQTDATAADAALAQARTQVEQIRLDIARTDIRAPFDGVLETASAETGTLLQAGALCATLLDLDPLRVVGFAPERAINAFREGTDARATLATGQTVAGIISFISKTADPNTRTFRVEIDVDNPDFSIRDGLSAEMMIPIRQQGAHLVPQSALTLNDSGIVGLRLVGENSITRFAPVQLLRDSAEGFWVGGLPEQADIVVVGQEFVGDGVKVRARPVEEALPGG